MSSITTITSNFTSTGKTEEVFYDNVEKIENWIREYGIPDGVDELLDNLNYDGYASTHYPERAYLIAYVLTSEGYDVSVEEWDDR